MHNDSFFSCLHTILRIKLDLLTKLQKPHLYDRMEAEVREMMGRRSGQIGMQIVDVEMMIPQNHLLRKIDRMVRFEFI